VHEIVTSIPRTQSTAATLTHTRDQARHASHGSSMWDDGNQHLFRVSRDVLAKAYLEMQFIGRFRFYSPFNAMLIRTKLGASCHLGSRI
jgi:hypothetical protein